MTTIPALPFTGQQLKDTLDAIDTKLDGIEDGATANPNAVASDPSGITGADAVANIVSLTQAEYDAIGSPDAATVYVITDAS